MREVDTLRLFCPRQWMRCGWDFKDASPGKYLGSVKYGGADCMPLDEFNHLRWKMRAGEVAIAEWNWSWPYPGSPYLKDIWFDPFIMFEKEVTW